MKKISFYFFAVVFSLYNQLFPQSTFRISYDIASFDIAGNMVVTPANEYVFSGTNASFIPYYGNIVKLDNTGGFLWAKSYTGGIATAFNDLKNVSTGGFVTCGQSSSGGAIIVRVDNSGNVIWAKRYLLPDKPSGNASNEFFNSIIETSDGGFLAVGGVDYFWDGVSANTVDTTSFFAVKVNSSGTLQWSRVWTIGTGNTDENYFMDCAESSNGYLLVGMSSDLSQSPSNGDYPRDAFLVKVDKTTGANIFINRFGNGNSTSQMINGVKTLSNGHFLIGGSDDVHAFVARLDGTSGSASQLFGRRINGSAFPPTQYVIQNLMENSDGNYSFIGWRISGLIPTLNSAIIKMNSSTGAIMLGKAYAPIGLSAILPKGGIVPSDQGYFLVNTDQQVTGFNYNVIRTDQNGDIGVSVSGCTNTSINPGTTSYNITFQAVATSTYAPASEAAFSPIVNNLTPTTNVHCLNCNLSVVPTLTATPNPICAGQSATIAVTNTVSGYNYNVFTTPSGGASIGSAPLSVSPSTTTTYYVEVQSQSNPSCLSTTRTPVTITVNPTPTLGITTNSNPICAGNTLTLTASGATSYTWAGPSGFSSNASSTIIPNISLSNGGTYTLTGSTSGCSTVALVSITVNPTPSPTASANSPLCAGNTLSLNASPNGLSSYNWSGPSSFTSAVQNPTIGSVSTANSGTYTLTVTNSSGCSASTTLSVTVNNGPSVSTTASGTITCSNPTVQIIGTTTTSPASYTWTGTGIVSGANSATAVVNQPGTFTLTVAGVSGCPTITNVIVSSNTSTPNISASSSGSITCAINTVQIVGSSTTSPVSYSWTGSGIVSGANSATAVVNAGGNYTLNVTNTSNGCSSSTVITVNTNTTLPTVNAGSNQTLTCLSSSVTLIGSANPSTVIPTWLGGVCGSTNSFTTSACSPNIYTLSVTNPANGCVNQSTVQVFADVNVPSVSLSGSGTITCINPTVQIIATTTSSPVSYTWSGPGIINGNGTATITVNASGNYSLTVTNTSNGCSSSTSYSVTIDNTPPSPTISVSNTITCSNTTATVIANPGTGSFNYTWTGNGITNGQGTSTIEVNQGGTYTLNIVNTTNGCSTSATVAVMSNTTAPSITTSPSTQTLSCATPTSQIVASGSSISYTWNGSGIVSGANSATVTINNPGTYTVIGTAANGCTAVATASVFPDSNAPNITLSASNETITCSNPSPTITASTGTMTNVSFTWTPSTGISGPTNTSTATFTSSGTYTLIVTNNSNGCSTYTTVSISTNTTPPNVSTSVSNSITCNTTTAQVVAFTTDSPVSYSWLGSGIVSGLGTGTIVVNQGGTFTVTVTNTSTGCSYSTTINVPSNMNLPININGATTLCSGQTTTLNATGATSYTWSTGDNTSSIVISPSVSTTYSVVGTNGICTGTAIANITVNNTPTVSVTPTSATIQVTESIGLQASGATSYSWIPSDGLNSDNIYNPVASPTVTTFYCVYGTTNGCTDSVCVKITVDNNCGDLFVPNIFSPNGDNNNDELCVYGTKCIVKDYLLVIYDRWGEKVFETTDKNACWDGTYKGKELNGATFVYYIKGTKYDNTLIEKKGNVTLVR
ncbi:MAG TPA: gliding motility-associated C-terminal domain-containing protein [Bacteroidia bacterium]|nr:gliding motility-associated C-terminal domain-containing protein [Bacteroidia bacterium]